MQGKLTTYGSGDMAVIFSENGIDCGSIVFFAITHRGVTKEWVVSLQNIEPSVIGFEKLERIAPIMFKNKELAEMVFNLLVEQVAKHAYTYQQV